MKKTYPCYKKKLTSQIVDGFSKSDKDFFENGLKKIGGQSGEKQAEKKRTVIAQFRDIIGKSFGSIRATEKDAEMIKDYYRLVNKHKERWSRNDVVKLTKRFLKRNYPDLYSMLKDDDEFIELTRAKSLKKCVNRKKLNKAAFPTKEEIEKLLKSCKTLRDILLMILIIYSGARPHEIVKLVFGDAEFKEEKGLVNISIFSDKTEEPRTLPLKEPYAHILQWKNQYWFPDVSEDDYMFPKVGKRGEHLEPYYVNEFLKKLCKRAGVRRFNAYIFRHRLLTIFLKKLPPVLYEQFAGHSYAMGVAVYGHLDTDDLEEVLIEEIYTDEVLPKEEKERLNLKIEEQEKKMVKRDERIEKLEGQLNAIISLAPFKAALEEIQVRNSKREKLRPLLQEVVPVGVSGDTEEEFDDFPREWLPSS